MYTIKERDKFFKTIINNVKESPNLIGTYLIGSSSIGFNNTIPKTMDIKELNKCKDKILNLFLNVIERSEHVKFDPNSKYLLEIAD